MKIQQVLNILNGELICGKSELLEDEIDYGYSCDLMSDVLAYVQNNVLLLTGLIHPQVIRTAEMLDIKAILIVRGKKPSEDIIDMANERDIVIIRTTHSLFTASGLLFQQGLLGEEIAHDEIHL
jgi:predicted transcriptional regulator